MALSEFTLQGHELFVDFVLLFVDFVVEFFVVFALALIKGEVSFIL
jgi:hypothetical protein